EICKDENLPILDVKFLRNNNMENIVSFGNKVYKNDRVILMDGENSGEVFTIKENGYLGSTLKKLEIKNISLTHFMDFMLLYFKDLFRLNKKGAAIPHLDKKLFLDLPIPLPPLKEQEKIVKILDELFTLKKALRVE
ncbi:restriction endonuclease subunit S, partial [Campylobacter sp. LR291e]|uniref:restriction endonuclease subunit S n=1 Tax=Campylobacter sp. LR291e TaxID=2593546 RepID=UPI001289FAC7